MVKPSRKRWPELAKAWDAYGHHIKFDDLFDMKSRNGYYVALAWKEDDGSVNYADLARGGNIPWDMQNDSHDTMPLEQWKRLKTVPECDWLIDPKEAGMF